MSSGGCRACPGTFSAVRAPFPMIPFTEDRGRQASMSPRAITAAPPLELARGAWVRAPETPSFPRGQADAGWGPGPPFPPPALTTLWSLPQGLPPVQACLGPSRLCPSSPVGGWSTDVAASVRAGAGGWSWLGREGPVGWPAPASLPPGPGPRTGAQGGVLTLRDNPAPGFCPPRGQPWGPARSCSCQWVPAPHRPSALGSVPCVWPPGWGGFRAPGGGRAFCRTSGGWANTMTGGLRGPAWGSDGSV